MTLPLVLAAEVEAARAAGRAVVALESALVTHGLPSPHNLAATRAAEVEIRTGGAVPATIAVIDGAIRVGLTAAELERLAATPGVAKLSRAELAVALSLGATGSTTVAATMICVHLAGIAVFATGGIGGVHRGGETSLDVSADLHELARTPVTVVAAGAKAILDLPRTLEVLETLGVPVIAIGQDAFPAFWSRDSGLAAPLRLDDPAAIAAAHAMRRRLGLAGGQLVANPIPAADEIPRAALADHIDAALEAAARAGVSGKAVTPFLLSRINEATGGATLAANVALVRNNARVAARIACAIGDPDRDRGSKPAET